MWTLKSVKSWQKHRSVWISMILAVVGLYIILPQLGSLHNSWHLIMQVNLIWIIVAILLTFLTYLFAAGNYYFLAFTKLSYLFLILVQLAATFINKLLPAGIGAVGANFAYLRHSKHSVAQASTVVAVNNLVGVAGHILILLLMSLSFAGRADGINTFYRYEPAKILEIVVPVGLIVLVAGFCLRSRARVIFHGLRKQMLFYSSNPFALVGALGTSFCLSLANISCLYACSMALNIQLPFLDVVIIFTLGVSVGTATPTPGGLGGFEAGLFGGLIAYHVTAANALAITLVYRLISFWLPILLGAPAFVVCQRLGIFNKEPEGFTSRSD